MNQYIGNLEDKCFFYRCRYCMDFSTLIPGEKELHEKRCKAVHDIEAKGKVQEIMRKLPNIEAEDC